MGHFVVWMAHASMKLLQPIRTLFVFGTNAAVPGGPGGEIHGGHRHEVVRACRTSAKVDKFVKLKLRRADVEV